MLTYDRSHGSKGLEAGVGRSEKTHSLVFLKHCHGWESWRFRGTWRIGTCSFQERPQMKGRKVYGKLAPLCSYCFCWSAAGHLVVPGPLLVVKAIVVRES